MINSKTIFQLPRWQKRLLMILADCVLLPLAVWLSFSLRLGSLLPNINNHSLPIIELMVLAPITSIPIFIKFKIYLAVTRYIGGHAIITTLNAVIIASIVFILFSLILNIHSIPKSFFPIYIGTAFLFIGGSRYFTRHLYRSIVRQVPKKKAVAVYGAGQTGQQLVSILSQGHEYNPYFYIDDEVSLQDTIIGGLKVFSPQKLSYLIEKYKIKQILLAMPSASNTCRQNIITNLEKLPVHVRTIPDFSDIISGKSKINDLKEITIEDLLDRSVVEPNKNLLSSNISSKNILVTGAGGSIGSEICRQIIRQNPSRLILFEISEFALYTIEKELSNLKLNTTIIPVLGSVQDQKRLEDTLSKYKIHTLYHTAAYKHVPMVENNPVEGLKNNTLGTFYVAKAALNNNIERFVLISTDKAVRPTNVMGASKRLCELIVQGFGGVKSNTIFCMVRFGNVLGSSGSVVPLFRKQIKEGGPLTVTHPDIIRYFMTIPEAAQLVIQAGSMATGGEVFLLDMGKPVKIVDLAKRMIRLSGLRLRTDENHSGDIDIIYTGLRPGEKLYEELLIKDNAEPTTHPQIFKSNEDKLTWQQINTLVAMVEQACNKRDKNSIYNILSEYVTGYCKNTSTIPFSSII